MLEIGIDPGLAIKLIAASAGHVAGVDPSPEMMRQATKRNTAEIRAGRVELQRASAERIPFADQTFDKALANNSMHLWPNASAELCEARRVLTPGGRAALTFTTYSDRRREELANCLRTLDFLTSS